MSALRAARAELASGAACGGAAADRPRELDRAALPFKGAYGVAAQPDCVRPLIASLGGPFGALRAVEAASASTHRPGADQQQLVVHGGSGAGPARWVVLGRVRLSNTRRSS